MAEKPLKGGDYVICAEHPRRPGQPLRVTTADGTVLGVSGQSCEDIAPALLASMLANGYIERVSARKKA